MKHSDTGKRRVCWFAAGLLTLAGKRSTRPQRMQTSILPQARAVLCCFHTSPLSPAHSWKAGAISIYSTQTPQAAAIMPFQQYDLRACSKHDCTCSDSGVQLASLARSCRPGAIVLHYDHQDAAVLPLLSCTLVSQSNLRWRHALAVNIAVDYVSSEISVQTLLQFISTAHMHGCSPLHLESLGPRGAVLPPHLSEDLH